MQSSAFVVSFRLVALSLFAGSAFAADDNWREWLGGERLRVGVGAFFSSVETEISASEVNQTLNAAISFEDDLGLDSHENTFTAFLDWRFAKRHSVVFNYFELDRNGDSSSTVAVKLDFGDFTFVRDVNLPVESFFNIEVYDVSYRYSPIFDERKELFLGIGLSVQDLNLGISGFVPVDPDDLALPGFDCTQGSGCTFEVEQVETTAPLPTLEIGGTYTLSDNWQLTANAGYFAVSLELDPNEDFSGRILAAGFGIRWKPFRNFGVFGEYNYFDVDVDYEKRDLIGVLDYRYKGPVIGVEAFF